MVRLVEVELTGVHRASVVLEGSGTDVCGPKTAIRTRFRFRNTAELGMDAEMLQKSA